MNTVGITDKEFKLFQKLIYDEFGISLGDRKKTLVQSRLKKWLKNLHVTNYIELYEYFLHDKSSLSLLADAITTNVTSFFREASQWEYLKGYIVTCKKKKLRIWSSACSSGQEPYTIAIFLKENLRDFQAWDIKILATDLSTGMLKKAIKGEYTQKEMKGLTRSCRLKYFHKNGSTYIIKQEIKNMVVFKSFNLVTGEYNMFRNKFNLIFCRNVMIYFDKNTQLAVIDNLTKLLGSGDLLLLGHSESITAKKGSFKSASSSIYIKG